MSRDKNIFINIILSCGIKGLGMLLSLFLMPAYMNYFENQQILGLWFTLLSVLNWILTFDFGIGNGLRNNLVKAKAKKDINAEKVLISTTYWLTLQFACILFLGCTIAVITINWNSFFNIPDNMVDIRILQKAVFIILLGIVFQFIFKTISSILLALHMPSISNLVGLTSNIIILITVLSLKTVDDITNLINLAYVYLLASNLPLLVTSIIVFSTIMKHARPSFAAIDRSKSMVILKLGGGFFALQLLSLAMFNMKEFLISCLSGPQYVVEFQVYNRIFNLIASIAWIGLIPIWSAVSEAYEKSDYSWIASAYRRLKQFMILIITSLILLIFIMQKLVNFWLGDKAININIMFSITFGTFCALYIWWGIIASFANGTGKIRTQLVMSFIGVVLNFTLSIIFVYLLNSWIGIIYANIISMLPYCIKEPFNINKIIREGMTGQDESEHQYT
mgnify:CR=1 FL=1